MVSREDKIRIENMTEEVKNLIVKYNDYSDVIRHLIREYPKTFNHYINKNNEMMVWIDENKQTSQDNLKAKIWSIINNTPTLCKNGNERKIVRITNETSFCSSNCQCQREYNRIKSTEAKAAMTKEQKEEVERKKRETNRKNRGYDYPTQSDEVKSKINYRKISNQSYEILNNKEWLHEQYINKDRTLVDIADEIGVYYTTVKEYLLKYEFEIKQVTNRSMYEDKIANYIKELGINNIIYNNQSHIGCELDIFIPDKNLAIEVNGLYYHSFASKDSENDIGRYRGKNRHINKTTTANKKDISIVHITDYEWNNNNEKIKNIIKSRLGLNKSIYYARNCFIKILPKDIEKDFLNNYHLQNYVPSTICYGLYTDNNELLSVASFGKSRYNKNYEYELLRFCNKFDTNVIGGLSKLITNFKRNYYDKKIISYCDRSKFDGRGYISAGFKIIGYSDIGYYWNDGKNIIVNRQKTTHEQLKKWLPTYNPELSQTDNMFNNKFYRYWDCGQIIFEI